MKSKEQALKDILRQFQSIAITYSGGIDSTYLLKIAIDTLGSDHVLAIVVNSELFSDREFNEALDIAEAIGARAVGLEMHELDIPEIAHSSADSWYHSKKLLYQTVKDYAQKEGFDVVADGMNMDDQQDYRPGLIARDEAGIRSFLQEAGLYKADIQQLAKEAGLETWNKKPSCSIISRFPQGQLITVETATAVLKGEDYLHDLGYSPVRVRVHGDVARIEVPADRIEDVIKDHESINQAFKDFGFLFVALDLQGYGYGRMNETIDPAEKEKVKKHLDTH